MTFTEINLQILNVYLLDCKKQIIVSLTQLTEYDKYYCIVSGSIPIKTTYSNKFYNSVEVVKLKSLLHAYKRDTEE